MKKFGLLTILFFTFTTFSLGQTAKDFFDRGLQSYKNKQYAAAVANYSQAIKLNPNSFALWFNRGQAYYYLGNLDLAIVDYTQALKLNPTYMDALFQRGLAYNRKGNQDAAIADYSQGIGLAPNDAQFFYNRGIAYFDKGNLDSAFADYNQALKLNPNYVKAFVNRGSVYYKKKQFDLALTDLNAAIKLEPTYAEAWGNRGMCYSALNQFDLAIADFTQAIKIDANYAKGYLDRAIAYNKKKQNDLAFADLNQAIKLNPNYVGAYLFRGAVYFDIKKFDLSKADMEKVLQLSPGHKMASDLLARINGMGTPATPSANLPPKSQAIWTPVSPTKGIDTNVALVGQENGQKLPLCRATYNGGTHPGKIVNGKCHIGYNGTETNVGTYEVLTSNANPSFSLNTTGNGEKFIVGAESNGQPLYLCSAAYQNGTYPGKIVNGKCNITWGGNEISLASFNTYYLPPKPATKPTSAPVSTVASAPTDMDGYIQKAQLQFRVNQFREAVVTASACIAAFPSSVTCHFLRGQSYAQLAINKPLTVLGSKQKIGEPDPDWLAAVADMTKVISLAPGIAEYYYQRAYIYYRSDGYKIEPYELGLADLKKALELNPNHLNAKALIPKINSQYASKLFSDGNRHVMQGQVAASQAGKAKESTDSFNVAISVLTKAIEYHKSELYLKRRGEAYVGLKKYDLALADYTEAIKLKPENGDAFNLRAAVYVAQKNYPLALADYDSVIALPDKSETKYAKIQAFVQKGDIYRETGKLDLAIAEYTKTIAASPDHGHAMYGRGLAYYKKGDAKAAEADFQKMLATSYDPEAMKKELGQQGIPPYNKLYPPAPNKK
ncbi:MAG: DUF3421 domain-containing protein [Blastocatellia bacterium]|nr:DUF3421 domain-containing protein [Blastocatellia bacterium]